MVMSEEGSTRVEATCFDTVTGIESGGDGWRFTVTEPLRHLGIPVGDGSDEMTASIKFNPPADGLLTGVVKTGDDVSDGRSDSSQSQCVITDKTAVIYISNTRLSQLGCPTDTPPTLEVWAGDGAIIFKPIEEIEYSINELSTDPLSDLPDQVREDYIAIVEEGKSPAEWAEERGLNRNPQYWAVNIEDEKTKPSDEYGIEGHESQSPKYDAKYYITRNVEKAKRHLDAHRESVATTTQVSPFTASPVDVDETKRTVSFTNTGLTKLHLDQGTYRVSLTPAIRNALPDFQLDSEISLKFDLDHYYDSLVPAHVVTGSNAKDGRGRRDWRKVTDTGNNSDTTGHIYRVRLPDPVLNELGYETENGAAVGEYINILAGDRIVAFQQPITKTYTIG